MSGDANVDEARRLLATGKVDAAIERLLLVDKNGRAYPNACMILTHVVVERGRVDFKIDHFLQPFLKAKPASIEAERALALLAAVYRREGHDDMADEIEARLGATTPAPAPTMMPSLPSLPALAHDPPPQSKPIVVGELIGEALLHDPDVTAPLQEAPPLDDGRVFTDGAKPRAVSAIPLTPPSRPRTPTPASGKAPIAARATPASGSSKPPSASTPGKKGAHPFAIGARIAGRYEVLDVVGKGGMATVFRVRDDELAEEVALKVFHANALTNDDEIARFKRELKLARRLRHPNIVQLFDLGSSDGFYFITMELLEGNDLHRIIKTARGPLPLARTIALATGILDGLAAAHALGVVHRDIKPGNVFVTVDGEVKIMDFGIAKGTVDSGDARTRTGIMMGTPQYMAPEQAQDAARVGPPSDLYAIGVVLFELLTGKRPFDGDNAMAILLEAMSKPAPRARTLNPAIPAVLDELIASLLQKSPEKRPQTCAAILSVLRAHA